MWMNGVFGTVLLAMTLCFAFLAAGCGDDDDDDGGSPGDDDTTDDDATDDDTDDDSGDDDTWPPLPDDDADDDDTVPPPDHHLLPGIGEDGYDADLEAKARIYDRAFHALITPGHGLNADLSIPVENTEDRDDIEDFLQNSDSWDFEDHTGKALFDVVQSYHKVAGLYGGVGIAADAFRYAVLRDQGYAQEEVDRAREHLLSDLDAMHIAQAITGEPGVIARGFMRLDDVPSDAGGVTLVPLFDGGGDPLPPEKTNGTWREDNSGGDYPNYIWEDSCSRDMFFGWASAMATSWEVIRDDDTFPDDVKDRLQDNARLLAESLQVVRDSGYDLEIFDADGRTTYHGYLNEHNYDRIYLPWLPVRNGVYALMALGTVAALEYVAEDPGVTSYLYDTLIGDRELDVIAATQQIGQDLWVQSNYSGYNMTFQTVVLAHRYLRDEDALANVRDALANHIYDHPNFHLRQPKLLKQSLFDFVYAGGMARSSAYSNMTEEPDADAVANGIETLREYPDAPFWDYAVENCDADEIASTYCELNDGTPVRVMGYIGRNDSLVLDTPVPMRVRPPSNYFWRSNPFGPNGEGNGSGMLPAVDFRWAYWLGRYTR
ncbi:MAG: hypothetical protein IT350_20800 [Deltaproteobacteria bacterium]|nr:hypothetical protein [Deltaproteobacteria bacterium]